MISSNIKRLCAFHAANVFLQNINDTDHRIIDRILGESTSQIERFIRDFQPSTHDSYDDFENEDLAIEINDTYSRMVTIATKCIHMRGSQDE